MKQMQTQQISNLKDSRKLLMIAGTGWLFDAMDVGLLSFILVAVKVEWGLSAEQLGWIGSVNSIGMAVGAFLFGIYADKKGRKAAFMVTLLLFSIASGLSAFAWGLSSFMVLRFFIGMGLGGELPVASTLVSESVAPSIRGQVVVLLESFWALGWIAAALMAYFLIPLEVIGWRGVMLLCALPAFYVLYLRRTLPDASPYVDLTQQDKKESLGLKVKALWAHEFRRRTLMLWILWFCVVFSYYGMFLWLPSIMMMKGFDLIRSFGYVLLMTLAQLPGYFTVAWLIERIGRKKVLVIYLLGTLLAAYGFGVSETATQLLFFGALLSFFNLGAWGAMYAYTPEQYSTKIRGTGAGVAASIGRLGGVLGPLTVGYLVAANVSIAWVFAVFSVTILVAAIAVAVLGQETKNQALLD